MRVIGLMSGTSYDAIDVAVADFARDGDTLWLDPLGALSVEHGDALRERIAAVLPARPTSIEAVCRLDTQLGQAFATAAERGIAELATGHADLVVSHGQTVFHWVESGRALGTLQLGSPAWIAGLDRRAHRRTGAVGPAYRGSGRRRPGRAAGAGVRRAAARRRRPAARGAEPRRYREPHGRAPRRRAIGYDVGPANALLDAAAQRLYGESSDMDGRHAAAGRVHADLLAVLLAEPYYARAAPKSTGKELFHAGYLDAALRRTGMVEPDDVLATLTELTARIVADACDRHAVSEVIASGGGVRNPVLMARLSALGAGGWTVSTTDGLGAAAPPRRLQIRRSCSCGG